MPGTVHLLPQELPTRVGWKGRFDIAALEFSSKFMERLLDGRAPAPSEQVIRCRNVPDPIAFELTRRVVEELAMPTDPLYGELLCLAIGTHVLRQYGRAELDALRFSGRLSAGQAGRVLDYMHANLDDRLSVSALAREAGLSDAYFARAFRATFKVPPHRMVLRWRLERAIRLAAKSGYSLAEAAVTAGFCDQAHFTNAVRRHFGAAPGKFLQHRESRHQAE